MEEKSRILQQLYRRSRDERGERAKEPLFPATLTRSVYDGRSGLTLDTILRYFNSVYLPYQGTDEATRLSLPQDLRREGVIITYKNLYGVTVNERCLSEEDKDTDAFGEDRNWVRLFYVGNEYIACVDRGDWKQGTTYYCQAINPTTGRYETSDVWMMGCKYRCLKTGTQQVPSWNSTDWRMIEGNPAFTVDFEEADTVVDPEGFEITLTLKAMLYNRNIIDEIPVEDITWSRQSFDSQGVERTTSDTVWNLRRHLSGKSIRLSEDDIDGSLDFPSKISFTAVVTLSDAAGDELTTDSITYAY